MPLHHTITVPPGVTTIGNHETDGNTYILDGMSQSAADLPVLSFISNSNNTPYAVTVGDAASLSPTALGYGELVLGGNADVRVTQGLTVNDASLLVNEQVGGILALQGNSLIENGGTMTMVSYADQGILKFDHHATLTLNPLGTNQLNLDGVNVTGSGTIVQQGENDATHVGSVGKGVSFDVLGGTLDISRPSVFKGTIGPDTAGTSIGIFGQVDVYQVADATRATFDTSSGFLNIFNSSGQDLAHLHFGGDASNLVLTHFAGANYIAIDDHPGGGGIPIMFT